MKGAWADPEPEPEPNSAGRHHRRKPREESSTGSLAYLCRTLVQANLPCREPASSTFERRNGGLTLTLQAPPSIGLPYGRYPRLLLAWIGGEAVRTRSRELDLGTSLTRAMRSLGLTPNGGSSGPIGRFRDQLRRLTNTTISTTWTAPKGDGWVDTGFRVSEESVCWWRAAEDSGGRLVLSEGFLRELLAHPVPVDFQALRLLAAPLAMDLYTFVRYRAYRLRRPALVPWRQLASQLGSDALRERKVREALRRALHDVIRVDPRLPARDCLEGLVVLPTPEKRSS